MMIARPIHGSTALVADGSHMSTHTGALALAALAYRFAHGDARDPRFSLGHGCADRDHIRANLAVGARFNSLLNDVFG
jgi:hypothetical protein